MSALTLLEASKLHAQKGDHFVSAITEMFARSNVITRLLPFVPIKGSAFTFNREQSLPGVAFRGINETYTSSTGVVQSLTEPLRISGGIIDVDKFIIDTQGPTARSVHEAMKIKAIMEDFMRTFFKGDSSINPKAFDGLQRRLVGEQKISNGTGSPSGGKPLSLAKLDEALDAVNNPTDIFMSKAMKRILKNTKKTLDADVEFINKQMYYDGIPVHAIEDASGRDTILPFDEVSADGVGSDCTSIYIVSLGPTSLVGIQNEGGLDAKDLKLLDSGTAYRTIAEWYVSFVIYNGRSAARLYSITNAAATA